MAGVLLWQLRGDLAYHFSPKEPLFLGAEGAYQFGLLASNRYAQVHGTPSSRGAYSVEDGTTYVVVGLTGTPLLVRRRAMPHEAWTPGTRPPRPDQTPFAVRGRLVSRADAGRYEEAFRVLESSTELSPGGGLWLLIEGERPGEDPATALWLFGLGAFAAVNLWFAFRALRR